MDACELAIVGAGPAGLAAAITARSVGLSATIIDEQPAPGGQIYRGIEAASQNGQAADVLGEDYAAGAELVREFRASGAGYMPLTQVWQIDRQRNVWLRNAAGSTMLAAKQVVLATGAMERPVPVPGWTLPGVMTCGAAQTLLKSAGLAPQGRVVLAGSGPLLLLLAVQLTRAGLPPAAVLETRTRLRKALPHFPAFALAPGYLRKGLAMQCALGRAGVPIERDVSDLRIVGESRAEAVEYVRQGARRRIDADIVLLHAGVVPNANLAWSLRCDQVWNEAQRAFTPRTGPGLESSIEGVLIAGDCGGIAGAKAAELSGRLAGYHAACAAGRIDAPTRDRYCAAWRRQLQRHVSARPFLDAYFEVPAEVRAPRDDATIVCRCEEVRAGEVRHVVRAQGCPGPNQMKAFLRTGMGPCQGRLCGLTVVELIAETRGVSPADVGYYRIRPPIKPVTIGDLAGPAA